MKSIPRAIICATGLVFACLLITYTSMPIDREDDVYGWEFNTTRNTSHYIIKNNLTASLLPKKLCSQQTLLLVVICSAPENFEARQAIRDTWASERNVLGSILSFYFLLGQLGNSSMQKDIIMESDKNQDIIQERFIDSYNNLTLKSIAMLKIAMNYCFNNTRYLLKIDDDMFLNVPKLIEMVLSRNSSDNVLLGKLIRGAKPIKDSRSKWYCPGYMYHEKVYPNYLSGTGYLMSMDVASRLFEVSLYTPIFYLEDIYLTGICARKAKIKPRNSPPFTYVQLPNEPCEFQNLVTMHHFTPDLIRETYTFMKEPDLNKTCANYKPTKSSPLLLKKITKSKKAYRK